MRQTTCTILRTSITRVLLGVLVVAACVAGPRDGHAVARGACRLHTMPAGDPDNPGTEWFCVCGRRPIAHGYCPPADQGGDYCIASYRAKCERLGRGADTLLNGIDGGVEPTP